MSNNNKIKVWKFLFAWEEEKEENWLREMALQGYHLTDYKMFRYYFKKGEPKDYIYKFDFQNDIKDLQEYLGIFKEAGWEYITKYGPWFFFRTEAQNNKNLEIFTDVDSKIARYQRQMKIALFALGVEIIFINLLIFNPSIRHSEFIDFIRGLIVGLSSIMVFLVAYLNSKIKKLKQHTKPL